MFRLCRGVCRVRDSNVTSLKADGLGAEIGRAVSILVALACLAIARFSGSGATFHFAIAVVVLPLGCIWYGNEIGGFVGISANEEGGDGNVVGVVITVTGWVVLVSMLAFIVFFAFGRSQ
jgi:hypothetical protein